MLRRLLHISLSTFTAVALVFGAPGVFGVLLGSPDKASAATLLDLPRIPWEGGPNYWKTSAQRPQFAKADAAGWDDPSFFPISVFLGKPSVAHVASLKDAGINLYMAVEKNPDSGEALTHITDAGMFAMPHLDPENEANEWTPADLGNNPGAVAWFITDECEMGYSGCPADQYDALAMQQQLSSEVEAYNDGRFQHSNFGNGILRTFWSTDTMDDHVQLMDSASADKYTYTSPDVANIIDGVHDAPDWPNGVPVPRAYSYGWQADQMRRFQDPSNMHPVWTFVETAQPYLGEPGARTILPDEIEGAVWSALIHEARGIAYFQHNNGTDTCTATYSIVDCPGVHAKVKQINAKVKSLAPVLNTQSYYNATRAVNGFTYQYYTFNNGTDSMVKTYDNSLYVFAGLGMGDSTGDKTFTLPDDVEGTTVEVVGESRTIPVDPDRTFTDNFAQEYSHHVYKVVLGASSGGADSDGDSDGISDATEDAAPNSGDANDDGTPDSQQAFVTSLVSEVSGKYVTLEADSSCTITQASMSAESDTQKDTSYEYLEGLMDFTLDCGTPGFAATVRQYYHSVGSSSFSLRKFSSGDGTYQPIEGAEVQINEASDHVLATYGITDGGELDEDNAANGTIVDPSGLATLADGSLADTGVDSTTKLILSVLIIGMTILIWRKSKFVYYKLVR